MECMKDKQKNIELKNPFLVYGYVSPHYFCDREEESRKMLSALSNERNVTLIAPRRIGKTGLIKNVFYLMRQQEVGVSSDFFYFLNGYIGSLRTFPFYKVFVVLPHPSSAQLAESTVLFIPL